MKFKLTVRKLELVEETAELSLIRKLGLVRISYAPTRHKVEN